MSIKLVSAALDTFLVCGKETIVIRGVIDPESVKDIKADSYQRENVSRSKIKALANALENSSVPDVELGMRGEKIRESDGGKVIHLQDETFVIDGLQRLTGARHLMQTKPGVSPRIGALVHLNTDFNWERERFRILNQERTRISVNILLRNLRHDHESIDMIHKMTESDESFVLNRRVCWNQNVQRDHVCTALMVCRVAGILHSRHSTGGRGTDVRDIGRGLDQIMEKVGRTVMRDNIKNFFGLVDEFWGVKRIVYAQSATHMKGTFLTVLADIFTDHDNFWRNNRFFVEADLKSKIAKFPTNDPEVERLAGSGGKAREVLYSLLLNHINSGKRTKRLTRVAGTDIIPKIEIETENPILVNS